MNKSLKTTHEGYFSVPSSWISNDIERKDEKVAIISIFGQSVIDANGYKMSPLELMLGRNVFKRNLIKPITLDGDMMTGIEGYYDAERRTVFLHLTGLLDSSLLLKSLNKLNIEMQEKGFLVIYSNQRLQFARSLLLLFSISHILLLCHPNHVFDITYIHLFRTLDAIRIKFQAASSMILKGVPGVTKDWHTNGRLCSPRVLFLFSSRLIPAHILNATDPNSKTMTKNPLRKLEFDLEYQIYRLLRKSRVITNISSNSLFALPNNQPFVYVIEEKHEALLTSNLISDALDDLCNPLNSVTSNFKQLMMQTDLEFFADPNNKSGCNSIPTKSPSSITTLSDPNDADALSGCLLSTISSEKKRNLEHSFNQFLKQHIDEALTRGFDDSVGRHTSPIFFEVPKMSVWFEAFHTLYNYFIKEGSNSEDNQVITSLKNSLETDIRFSDARCSKVLPLAVASYKDGLPSHYTRSQHQTKLDLALGILASQARGPMYDKYLVQLEKICEGIWKDGRVGCETLSLTGNSCHNERHYTSNKDQENEQHLPVMDHASGVIYVNYCNCGHHTAQMDDPFSIKAANFDFYENLLDVCGRSDSYSFPTFKPSVLDAKGNA